MIAKNSRRKKHRLLRKYSVVLTSTGISITAISLIVKISGVLERFSLYSSEREYNIFMKIFGDFISSTTLVGGMLVFLGIALMALWYFTVAVGKRDSLLKWFIFFFCCDSASDVSLCFVHFKYFSYKVIKLRV